MVLWDHVLRLSAPGCLLVQTHIGRLRDTLLGTRHHVGDSPCWLSFCSHMGSALVFWVWRIETIRIRGLAMNHLWPKAEAGHFCFSYKVDRLFPSLGLAPLLLHPRVRVQHPSLLPTWVPGRVSPSPSTPGRVQECLAWTCSFLLLCS